MCLLGVLIVNKSHLGVQSPPKTPFWGPDFKPNMRKIQIAVSSDLCITLTWNLTGSCDQQQRLRGWSRMVVKHSKIADGCHFENRYIAITQWKIIGFSWDLVHSSRFLTGWTSRCTCSKWKSCIGQTPSSTERISCLVRRISLLSAGYYI